MDNCQLIIVGTYTQPIVFGTGQILNGKGEGIYSFYLDLSSGTLRDRKVASGIQNPSYLTLDRAGTRLYAVNELKEYEGAASGTVSSFAIDRERWSLKLLNRRATGGTDPCHVVMNSKNTHVYVSNFMSGSVCVLPVSPDGSLGEQSQLIQHEGSSVHPARQNGPHAHSLIFDISNNYAFVPDLGIDRMMAYKTDFVNGTLTAAPTPYYQATPGAGPRHCVFHPKGNYAYMINELSSTVSALRYNARNASFHHLQTISTIPASFGGENTCADVHIRPDGRFLYGSNRGHNSIVIYKINKSDGLLEYVGNEPSGGDIPRNFCIDHTGTYLLAANQDTDNIVVFRIDAATGTLRKVSEVSVPTPVCVKAYKM